MLFVRAAILGKHFQSGRSAQRAHISSLDGHPPSKTSWRYLSQNEIPGVAGTLAQFSFNLLHCLSLSQSAIEDKLDRKQWPFISDPAPINTTQTAVRWVLETGNNRLPDKVTKIQTRVADRLMLSN